MLSVGYAGRNAYRGVLMGDALGPLMEDILMKNYL